MVKTRLRSNTQAAPLATIAALLLILGLGVTLGSAQSRLADALHVVNRISSDALATNEPALGTLEVRNQASEVLALEYLTVRLPHNLVYVGQAAGSDVATAARVDGAALRWTGPFELASGETLRVRYWIVASGSSHGQGVVEASVSVGGDTLYAQESMVTVEPSRSSSVLQGTLAVGPPVVPATEGAISVVKKAEPTEVRAGRPVSYTIVFSNTTVGDVALDTITDVLPVPFHYVGLAFGSEVLVEPVDTLEPEIVWQGPFTVPASGELALRYWAWVPDDTQASPIPYTNTVTATYGVTSVGPAQTPVTVIGPDIQVRKSAPTEKLDIGDLVTYTVVLRNEGNAQGTIDRISDTLPTGFAFEAMLDSGTVTDPPQGVTGTIVWDGPFAVPVGTAITLTYLTSSTGFTHDTTNAVVAAVDGRATDPATATVNLVPGSMFLPLVRRNYTDPYFEVSKQASETWYFINQVDPVEYTVTFINRGDGKGVIQQIVDTLPGGLVFLRMLPGSDVGDIPDGTTGTIVWDGPFEVGPGGSLTLKYEVQIPNQIGTYENSATATTSVGFPPEQPARVTVKVTPPYLLDEDFESGTDGWEPFLSYWRLTPEQWYLAGGAGYGGSTAMAHTYWRGKVDPERGAHDALYMYQGAGAEQWTDYRVEAKVRLDEGSLIGLWVRGKYIPTGDMGDGKYIEGYYISWKADRDRHSVELWRCKPHFAAPDWLVAGGGRMDRYVWYDMAVEVRGSNIKVYINGDLVIDHDDSAFSTGTVGFMTYTVAYGYWDNVLVTPLD